MFVIKYKKIFLISAAVLVVASIISIFSFGLHPGIDFKGGSFLEVEYIIPTDSEANGSVDASEIRAAIDGIPLEVPLGAYLVQPFGDNGYAIKTRSITQDEKIVLLDTINIYDNFVLTEINFTDVGPAVGAELTRKAIFALVLVSLLIILFVAYSFRHISRPVSSWKYGLIATITLFHDIIIPAGIFAVISHYTGAEIDTLFVVALLTILGVSVNDTIVVFDRIRENLRLEKYKSFEETVGQSIDQTITRSINTSLTIFVVLVTLFIWGPESIKDFALVMLLGTLVGTYSSILIASPLLIVTNKKKL